MSPSKPEELEEIVISSGSDRSRPPLGKQVRRRSAEGKSRSSHQKSKSTDPDEDRGLLHANSEPNSRLEVSLALSLHGKMP